VALAVLVLTVAAAPVNAQTSKPAGPPPWKHADTKTTDEAFKAYQSINPALAKLDHTALAKHLADNRKPMLPKSKQTDVAVAELVAKLKSMEKDLIKTQQALADVEAAKPKPGKATMQETTLRGMDVLLVKIPLPGTADIAAKHKLGKGGWTGDDAGNVAVLMVRHEGVWFWNPFGW
jgi:hypothetical protein